MDIERRTPENTAIVMIDYVTGFANVISSQTIPENVAGGRALAQTALTFGVPLVLTMGPKDDPRGVLYSEIAAVVGDHPIVNRGLSFDCFDDEGFEAAVEETGRNHLVFAGLTTEGCITHTILSALRRDYEVSLVVDATASASPAAQAASLARLGSYGVTMTTWLGFASELQRTYANEATIAGFREIQANLPAYGMMNESLANVREILGSR
ncbi:hypothetical protein BWI15_00005 [Kribbella sp. ALI-6-A]|nr:hypothetical protein BWI15_00005 [Kribbella sp. ALI-6-A]